jgi:drug/metabolite transporter (DMT)-like permease
LAVANSLIIFLVIFGSFIGAIAAFMLKKSTNKKHFINKYTILGYGLYGFGALANIWALKYLDVTVVFPLTSTTYIWSLMLAKVYLNEKITLKKILGLSLIIFGVVFLII